jgi:hypothetical protein
MSCSLQLKQQLGTVLQSGFPKWNKLDSEVKVVFEAKQPVSSTELCSQPEHLHI